MNRSTQFLLVLASLITTAFPTHAAESAIQSHASIRDTARQHVAASGEEFATRSEVTIGRLDSRLKLAQCDIPLESYDSPNGINGGRGVVGVRCSGSKPWKIFVPVTIAMMADVVVSKRPLTRGQVLRADDLMLSEKDVSRLHKAYFTRLEDVIGLRSKRALSAGKTLHAGVLKREKLVQRGKSVSILAEISGLQVSMRGRAMADGSHGDQVRVKNLNSGRIISGIVAGNGLVKVIN